MLRPATFRSSARPLMHWTASARKPLPLAATNSMLSRSTSRFWSPPFDGSSRTRNNISLSWSGCRAARQAHGEHRALPGSLATDVAAHHLTEPPTGHQAESRATVLTRRSRGRLGELPEQLAHLLGRQADASVGDRQ